MTQLGRGTPGPAWIGKQCAAQRHHVGAAFPDDAVRLHRLVDHAHRAHRNTGRLLHRFGEMDLIAGAGAQTLQRRVAAARTADISDACIAIGLGDLDRLFEREAAVDPVGQRHACPKHEVRYGFCDAARDLDGKTHAVFERPAPLVVAPVRQWRQELMQQIAMRRMQFDEVEAGAFGALCRRNEVADRVFDALFAQCLGHLPAIGIGDVGGGHDRPGVLVRSKRPRAFPGPAVGGLAAGMGQLRAEFGARRRYSLGRVECPFGRCFVGVGI